MRYIGTIVARNYLAQALVLADSLSRTNSDIEFKILVLDPIASSDSVDIEGLCVRPTDLPIDSAVWNAMAASYSVMELATAIKAKFLEYLLDLGAESAIYLDPDIKVFASLNEVFDALNSSEIVLTPHCLTPVPRDQYETSEETIRHAGIFNLGFIAVSPSARPFLRWWHERLLCDAVVDLPHALFTDQRWIDFVPSLFNVHVFKHFGANVAYWNIQERKLTRGADGAFWVNEQSLLFFHFSGFDPKQPWLLTKHTNSRHRSDLSDNPILLELTENYARDLKNNGHDEYTKTPYGLSATASGIPLTTDIRRLFRESWRNSIIEGALRPPDPFQENDEAFCAWLREERHGVPGYRFTDLDFQLWGSRRDLQQSFPDPLVNDAEAFVTWLRVEPANEGLNKILLRQGRPSPKHVVSRRGGFSLLGYFNAELGVGEAGRRLVELFDLCGRPTELVAVSASASREHYTNYRSLVTKPSFDDVVLAVNADQTDRVIKLAGLQPRSKGRRIGFWFWELSHFPETYHSAFGLVDEIWCASDFIKEAIEVTTTLPVRRVHLPLQIPATIPNAQKDQVGLPSGFTFLFVFDFHSVINRKNPYGAIDAFVRAFSPEDGAHLVIKTINGNFHKPELSRLKWTCRNRPDIHVLDGYMSSLRVATQIRLSDCFVSLHRSEGYGLNIASAIALDRPVVATSYSGNLDFMPIDYPFLVEHTLTNVGSDSYPYPEDAKWAEPNIEHAATLMRWIFDNQNDANRIAADFGERQRLQHSIRRSLDQFRLLIS